MTTSRRMTSGLCIWARSTACSAVPPSATTSMSSWESSSSFSPERTTAWSSTIRTEMLIGRRYSRHRHLCDQGRARSRRGLDLEAAVEQAHALAHADQAEAAPVGGARLREPGSVVLDHDRGG